MPFALPLEQSNLMPSNPAVHVSDTTTDATCTTAGNKKISLFILTAERF